MIDMTQILIVDDEQRMRELLMLYLTPIGYSCTAVASGKEAVQTMKTTHFDLIILDVMMPEMDGWATCEAIRAIHDLPIMMLTARSSKTDVVKGLQTGADDYLVKPFDASELIARIEALLRRTPRKSNNLIEVDGIIMNEASHTVHFHHQPIHLTPKQFALLRLFLRSPNRVFERDELLRSVWGEEVDTEGRTIDSHIRNLRDKLKKVNFPIHDVLVTVWGIGYKWSR